MFVIFFAFLFPRNLFRFLLLTIFLNIKCFWASWPQLRKGIYVYTLVEQIHTSCWYSAILLYELYVHMLYVEQIRFIKSHFRKMLSFEASAHTLIQVFLKLPKSRFYSIFVYKARMGLISLFASHEMDLCSLLSRGKKLHRVAFKMANIIIHTNTQTLT